MARILIIDDDMKFLKMFRQMLERAGHVVVEAPDGAIGASSDGERVTVTIRGKEDVAIIRIHNTGVVPEDIRDTFFEKYVTSGKKMRGTGLGTYRAKLIAETQRGCISMSSPEENGTTISVYLPKAMNKER